MGRGTRIWIEGLLRALFSGMAGTLGVIVVDPQDFNFDNLGKLATVATIIGVVQVIQFLSQKPLPPDDDEDPQNPDAPITRLVRKINGTGSVTGLLLAGAIGLTGLAGCGKSTPITLPPAPVALDQATDQVHAAAIKALGILHAAGVLVDKASTLEADLARPTNGVAIVPAALHAKFRTGFRTIATQALAAIDRIEQGVVTDWPTLRALIEPILATVQQLVELVRQVGDQAGRRNLWAVISGLADLVSVAVPPGGGGGPVAAPAFGAR